jgi:hypothetical protein
VLGQRPGDVVHVVVLEAIDDLLGDHLAHSGAAGAARSESPALPFRVRVGLSLGPASFPFLGGDPTSIIQLSLNDQPINASPFRRFPTPQKF